MKGLTDEASYRTLSRTKYHVLETWPDHSHLWINLGYHVVADSKKTFLSSRWTSQNHNGCNPSTKILVANYIFFDYLEVRSIASQPIFYLPSSPSKAHALHLTYEYETKVAWIEKCIGWVRTSSIFGIVHYLNIDDLHVIHPSYCHLILLDMHIYIFYIFR